jgi:ABC-type uncharacterized transport system permease subunit
VTGETIRLFAGVPVAGAAAPVLGGIGLLTVVIAMIAIDRTSGLVREAAWFLPLLYTRVLVASLPAPLPDQPEQSLPP